jgi:toxin-antitoxin system PIN domain toxin
MIAVDTNLLVYAHRTDSEWHDRASSCLRELSEGSAHWAIPWPCVHEFLAIVTHPRVFSTPTPLDRALDQVDAWLESPSLVLLAESDESWPYLRELLVQSRVTGPKVHDARVAALCIVHGVRELWTADRDFGRFPALAARNPLAEAE